MKHTQGKVSYKVNKLNTTELLILNENEIQIGKLQTEYIEMHLSANFQQTVANAQLIAETFNITNNCGLTPAELLAQRNELLEALKEAKRCLFDRLVIDFNQVTDEKTAEVMAYDKLKNFLLYNAIKNTEK